ncbi:hypothetical protein AB1Y20_017622 [Prymnesium parvum]|uniref:At4g15545-like C-terminal domain-containing protein n=1 Tax=Prymnesium parvum TaxID=97485 RepID=A0AB34JNP7_PRYPA
MELGVSEQHPDEKFRHGLRLIEIAYDERSRLAELELNQLRSMNKERQGQITALESRVAELEAHMREANERANHVANERDLARNELKAVQRDMAKLDQFKRSILQSIKDEDVAPTLATSSVSHDHGLRGGAHNLMYGTQQLAGAHQYTPAIRSPATAATYSESYRTGTGLSAVPSRSNGAHRSAAVAPPSTPAYTEMQIAHSAPAPTPAPLGAPAPAPPSSSTAHVDGKDFFKAARLRLSYEQFNTFLINIRSLNDRLQTQEETLAQARNIFGPDNQDLFFQFKELLVKHGLT